MAKVNLNFNVQNANAIRNITSDLRAMEQQANATARAMRQVFAATGGGGGGFGNFQGNQAAIAAGMAGQPLPATPPAATAGSQQNVPPVNSPGTRGTPAGRTPQGGGGGGGGGWGNPFSGWRNPFPLFPNRSTRAPGLIREAGLFGRGMLGFSVLAGSGYVLGAGVRGLVAGEASREMAVADIAQRTGSFSRANALTMGVAGAGYYSTGEATEMLGTYSGIAGARNLGGFNQAAKLSRAFGFGAEQGAEIFGSAAREFGGHHQQERFAEMLATAIKRGRLEGLEGEVFQSILDSTKQISSVLGLSGNQEFAAAGHMASVMGGLGRTGIPSLMGSGALNTMNRMSEAAGGGFLNIPNYKDAIYALAAGKSGMEWTEANALLQSRDFSDPRYLPLLGLAVQTTKELFSGGNQKTQLMNIGVPPNAADAVSKIFMKDGGNIPEGDRKTLVQLLNREQNEPQDIRKMQNEITKDLAQIAKDLMPLYDKLVSFTEHVTGAIAPVVDKVSADLHKKGLAGSINDLVPSAGRAGTDVVNDIFGVGGGVGGGFSMTPVQDAVINVTNAFFSSSWDAFKKHAAAGIKSVSDEQADLARHGWNIPIERILTERFYAAIGIMSPNYFERKWEESARNQVESTLSSEYPIAATKDFKIAAMVSKDIIAHFESELAKAEKAHPNDEIMSMTVDKKTLVVTVTGGSHGVVDYTVAIPPGGSATTTRGAPHPAAPSRVHR